jgi:hypothetical protein
MFKIISRNQKKISIFLYQYIAQLWSQVSLSLINILAYLLHARSAEPQKPRNTHATIQLRIGSTRCQATNNTYSFSILLLRVSTCLLSRYLAMLWPSMLQYADDKKNTILNKTEACSNTSTVTLRVVGGDEREVSNLRQ